MLRSTGWIWLSSALPVCGLLAGCSKTSTPPAAQPTAHSPATNPGEQPQKPAEPAAPVKPPVPTVPPAEPDQVASTTGSKDATPTTVGGLAGKAGRHVTLGVASPALYAGIPGGGDLSAEEAKKWLAEPANHEVLDVRLPLGLSTGQSQMQGLKENPLTRAKIELGRQMYFDTRLSKDATVSCASCHDPAEDFAFHSQFGIGIQRQMGDRNSPVAYNRILSTAQFWDGRAASLEDQAKGPIANPIEMGFTHEECVSCIKAIEVYRLQFEKIFGEVTIDAVAKAIASFERSIVSGPSPFDYFEQWRTYKDVDPDDIKDEPEQLAAYNKAKAGYEKNKMSESAVRGREIFFSDKGACSACHVGANLSDEKFHNLGVGMAAKEPDLGRYNVTKKDEDRGAFKTPTIRNVALSAPYMHDGSIDTLAEVIEWYDRGGHPNSHLDPKIKKLNLSKQDKADLLAFLQACTGAFPKIERGRLPK